MTVQTAENLCFFRGFARTSIETGQKETGAANNTTYYTYKTRNICTISFFIYNIQNIIIARWEVNTCSTCFRIVRFGGEEPFFLTFIWSARENFSSIKSYFCWEILVSVNRRMSWDLLINGE